MKLLPLWVALALATAGQAAAQGAVLRRPALHWVRGEGATGCIDPRALAERVEELVGPVLVRASEAEHSIEGRVELRSSGLQMRVRVVDAAGAEVGERTLEHAGSDCAALTPAFTFVIAMMIDPGVAAHGLPQELVALFGMAGDAPEAALLDELKQEPEPEPESEPEPEPEPPREPVLASDLLERQPTPRFQAGVLLRSAYQEAPRVLLALDARLLYELRRPLSIGGYVRVGTQAGDHPIDAAASLRMSALDFGLLSCAGHSADRRFRAHGCAGLELSTVYAAGNGFGEDDMTPLAGVGLVGQATARLRVTARWGLAATVSLRWALRALRVYELNLDDSKEFLYEFPRASAGIALGPTYEF